MTTQTSPIDQILETDFWPDTIPAGFDISRIDDDNDGDPRHRLELSVGGHGIDHGDVYLGFPGATSALRFRTQLGGGVSPRVRNALLVLAEAMRRDNEDRPQNQDLSGIPKEPTADIETEVCLETLRRISSGQYLDPDIASKTTPEEHDRFKQAIQATAMDVFEKTWTEFLAR